MATPKKRHTIHKQGTRRSQLHQELPEVTFCPKCHNARLAHAVCKVCGTYRDNVIDEKKDVATSTVK